MARSRNIKPAFFSNDELAEIDPIGRILFIGLWTIADYKGCLVWRPKRVKAQLLPYDNCDIEKLAINLDNSGFIRFYSDEENIYIKVVNFEQHQNPHKNERDKGSSIPDYSEQLRQSIEIKGINIKSRLIAINPDKNGTDRADSLNLIPDSFNPLPVKPKRKAFKPPSVIDVNIYISEKQYTVDAESFINHYQSNGWMVGKTKMKDWKAAVRTWQSRSKNNETNQRNTNKSKAQRVSEKLDEIARKDIAENGFTHSLDG